MRKGKGTSTDFDAELGEKLKLVRLHKGISLETVANAIGISYQQIQKYEKGYNRISVQVFVIICDFYEISPSYILSEDFVKHSVSLYDGLDSKDLKFINAWRKLTSSETKKSVMDFVKAVIANQ